MRRKPHLKSWAYVCVLALAASQAAADVFNMGGTRNPDGTWNGLASLETVPVGNPGNTADTRYNGGLRPEGYGRVDYEYRIGRFEVTAGQYTEFLNTVAKTDTYGLYYGGMFSDSYGCRIARTGNQGSYMYSVAAEWANRPVNFVNWGDAARFANWLHNGQRSGAQDLATTEDGSYFLDGATSQATLLAVTRKPGATWVIPSENEWYKAAYYKGGSLSAGYWDYPTSSNEAPAQDLGDVSGNNANHYTFPYTYPIDAGKYTTMVGEFQNSESPFGTFDQGGNVWEWNEAVYDGWARGFRGGSFFDLDAIETDNLHAAALSGSDPENWCEGNTGFRMVLIPEPGTLGLFAVALGLVRRRRV